MASKPTNARNARHEQDDVSVRRIAKIALAILVSIGVCAASAALLVSVFVRVHERGLPTATSLRPPAIASEARLTPSPVVDLAAFRAQKDAMLHGYGWIDKEHGIVRIPIERAMPLLLEEADVAPVGKRSP